MGREPDAGGLNYWSNELDKCAGDAKCLRARRIDISAAFFVETEFQQSGSYIYRLYKAALGCQPTYAEFNADRSKVIGGAALETNKTAFAGEFVRRAEFAQKYSSATTAESFVTLLIQSMRQSAGVDLNEQRDSLIAAYTSSGGDTNESRSRVVREAIETASFKQAVYNQSFVLMQYFGYLKREPDAGGYEFWLDVLNNRDAGNYRGMVCSFITSTEYQLRFATIALHSNRECGQ